MDNTSCDDMAVSESDESSLSCDVSRLITEEDLIDSLFYTCAQEGDEKVPVSTLLEYLKSTTDSLSESFDENSLESLTSYLDPSGQNSVIDLSSYRDGISKWIRDLRGESRQIDSFSSPCISPIRGFSPDLSPVNKCLAMTLGKIQYRENRTLSTASHQTVCSTLSNTPTSLEGSGVGQLMKEEEADLINRNAELEFQNKRLGEENLNLRKQLEGSEDILQQMAVQIEEFKENEKCLLNSIDKLKEFRHDNEELKVIIANLEDSRNGYQEKFSNAKKEVNDLEKELASLHSILKNMSEKLELSQKTQENFESVLTHHRMLQEKAEEQASTRESQLREKDNQIVELRKCVEELDQINEGLKHERNELEIQLSTPHPDLSSINDKCGGNGLYGLNTSALSDEDLMPVKLSSCVSSTPSHGPSLCNELRNTILLDDSTVPSPLCEKELNDLYRSVISTPMKPERDIDKADSSAEVENAIDSALSSSVTFDRLAEKSSYLASQLKKEKREMMILNFSPSLQFTPEKDPPDNQYKIGSDKFKEKLTTEVSSYADRIASLWIEKKSAERRVVKLLDALKELEDHNKEVAAKNEEALKEVENESQRLNSCLKETVTHLQEKLIEEKAQCKLYQEEMNEYDNKIESLEARIKFLENDLSSQIKENETLKEENAKLTRSNLEIVEQYEKVEGQMTDLKNELAFTRTGASREKDKNITAEECFSSNKLQRQLDMKDLWRIVHKDVENECLTDSQELLDTPITVSQDSLRDHVTQEINSLRSQLARSQKALEVLVHARGLPLSSIKTEHDVTNNNTHGGNSPLVEALTLNAFKDGPRNGRNGSGRPMQGTSSADDILDGCGADEDEFDDNRNFRHGVDSTSCPHLDSKFVTSGTQTERDSALKPKRRAPQIGASRYTVANTSTGSSTSGVDVGSCSSRSDLLHPYRKSVLIIENVSGALSSPEDPDNPLCRYRTSSFKKAIERGASADSSNFESFDTYEPASTSPDISPDHPDPPFYPDPFPKDRINPFLSTQVHVSAPYVTVKHRVKSRKGDTPEQQDSTGHYSRKDAHIGSAQKPKQVEFVTNPESRQASSNISVFEQRAEHSSIMDQCKENALSRNTLEPEPTCSLLGGDLEGDDESPGRNRRLSTLVEEASDAEADESLSNSGRGPRSPRGFGGRPKSPRAFPSGKKQEKGAPDLLVPGLTAAQPPPYRKSSNGSGDTTNQPGPAGRPPSYPETRERRQASPGPPYREPPGYQEALARSRDSSPNPRLSPRVSPRARSCSPNFPRTSTSDVVSNVPYRGPPADTIPASSILPPYIPVQPPAVVVGRVTVQSPSPNATVSRNINIPVKDAKAPASRGLDDVKWIYTPPTNPNYKNKPPSQDKGVKHKDKSTTEVKSKSCEDDRQQSSTAKERRKALLEQSKSGSKNGQMIELVNVDVEEGELSEADKLINAQLLEEAQKASNNSKQRFRRGKKGSSSSDLARAQSFDEGGPEDEVFEKSAHGKDPLSSKSTAEGKLTSGVKANVNAIPEKDEKPITPKSKPKLTEDTKQTEKEDAAESERDEKKCVSEKEKIGSSSPKPFKISGNMQLERVKEESPVKNAEHSGGKQSKMPEVCETSETESVKGSGGSLDSAESDIAKVEKSKKSSALSESALQGAVFPSLPESVLTKLGLKANPGADENSSEKFSEQEVEEKFMSLSLAFKTDKLTLDKRIELHKRARDISEQNIDHELEGLKEAMKSLGTHCTSGTSREVYSKLQHHVDILEQSTSRMSSRAELHGAVQQELRISQAIDVMIVHVENLKRMYEKEHAELEETKKLLQDNKIIGGGSNEGSRFSMAGPGGAKGGRRRASVAVVTKGLGGLNPISSNSLLDMDSKSRLQSLLTDTSSGMATVVRRASTVGSTIRRLSLFAPAATPDFSPKITELSPGSPESSLRKRSTSESPSEDIKKSPVIIEEDEETDDTANRDEKPSALLTKVPSRKGAKKSVHIVEPEIDGNSNVKTGEENNTTDIGGDSDEEFQANLRQYLEDYMPEDEEEEPEYENIFTRIHKALPGWEETVERFRYTVAGIIFLLGILSLILTFLPVASATKVTEDIWNKFENHLAPLLSLRHHRPPPT